MKIDTYIRTNEGLIAQITAIGESFRYSGEDYTITRLETNKGTFYTNNVVKAKDRLCDLVEEGDIINGEQVDMVIDDFIVTKVGAYHKEALEIETMLTKEQYEKRSYKVIRRVK